ncbi:hypothetical protein D3C87_2159840 [compost metagenome]
MTLRNNRQQLPAVVKGIIQDPVGLIPDRGFHHASGSLQSADVSGAAYILPKRMTGAVDDPVLLIQ